MIMSKEGYLKYSLVCIQFLFILVIAGKAPIPSHIFGNMWAQEWGEIYPLVEPFDKAGVRPDATSRGLHFDKV